MIDRWIDSDEQRLIEEDRQTDRQIVAQSTPPFPTMEAVVYFSSGAVSYNQFMMRMLWLVIKAEMVVIVY